MTQPPAGQPLPRPPRNERLDRLLAELADLLAPAEDRLVAEGGDTRQPVVLVIGPPRSGTTLLTQWLAASGRFAVPTNLLARFSRTPALGARIQALLTDPRFAFGEELFDLAGAGPEAAFANAMGKTRGALAPNEFAFFWRRFLRTQEMEPLGAERLARADFAGLRAALAQLETVLGKPLAMKGMFVQYDVAAVAQLLPNAFFLRTRRDPVANAVALLSARERYHGDRAVWYSARPPGTAALLGRDPVTQVAGQVLFTERALDAGLESVAEGRRLTVGYEAFCAAPRAAWDQLRAKLAALGCDPGTTPGPERFDDTSAARAAAPDAAAVAAAFADLEQHTF